MTRTESGPRVVRLRGEHDLSTVAALSKTLARAISEIDGDLVVDLSEVTFIDASTVGAILRARKFLADRSRSLAVRSPSRLARRVLNLSGLGSLIEGECEPSGAALRTWVAVPATSTAPVPSLVLDREGS